ncbi:MAG: malate synthase A [Betaproteobacteria bacterium]|jgi:malate synthase|nr:malate synthase A [Rhodocyclaceae bacterium]MCA3133233.1 malate synthase A [Rhodocyclaceae bacterium]MCA3140644.1 malate synthase A [Rhodocyclaceae bacterium]MCA3144231.1 malate synthase A [Rhodocyclaceae bacterium]MCE2897852.1 malate synthase A [Betaproteobacteria bacterium]
MTSPAYGDGIQILARVSAEHATILTPEAVGFLATLQRRFNARRVQLLERRSTRQSELDAGKLPDFLPETHDVREAQWQVAPVPADLQDRRVEITGPTDRKMVINALNSGANMFMADFEDSSTPTWDNQLQGQINMRDAVAGTIAFTSAEGKHYRLGDRSATLLVRPRGWHLEEKHVKVDGEFMSGSLFDFGLYFFHNAKARLAKGSGTYFYLPKMESHLEARLWNDVFVAAQELLGVPRGTIKATVLIETILAAFEMDEILYELRDHSAGLNCGRWDYIFSCIKKLRAQPGFILADRHLVTMTSPFMRAYSLLLIKTCHRRGAFAMGGMAAQIPIKNDPAANDAAIAKVRADKEREATDGHDGTWVAHPGLVGLAREAFDKVMTTPNQIHRQRDDVHVRAQDLLDFQPKGPITEQGLRTNINIGIQYMGAWLAGTGCVPIFNLMEDAATAEISRAQIWHWIRSPLGTLDDGRKVTKALFSQLVPDELARVKELLGEKAYAAGNYPEGARLFEQLTLADEFADFLTLSAYDWVTAHEHR